MEKKHTTAKRSSTFLAIKTRTILCLLATLILTLLAPMSPATANGNSDVLIQLLDIKGVTPPIPGAIPDETIDETIEYTGTVSWSSIAGPLVGNFETATIYAATIILDLKPGYIFNSDGSFIVAGAADVSLTYFDDERKIIAIFNPAIGNATDYLDRSFGNDGAISVRDIFGDIPLNETGTAVGPIKVDRIAMDSQDRIVVLASFYGASNQVTEVSGANGTEIGTGFQNSLDIAAQVGNFPYTSAAVLAREFTSTVSVENYVDWYLPSKEELNALYTYWFTLYPNELQPLGMSGDYWSSSESGESQAFYRSFTTENKSGGPYPSDAVSIGNKSERFFARPIRAGFDEEVLLGGVGPGGGTVFYVDDSGFTCGPDLALTCNYLEVTQPGWSMPVGPLKNGTPGDPTREWASYLRIDNHILFRLNPDGSYDNTFGNSETTLRKHSTDTPKKYVLVTTTGPSYVERVDLEIDLNDDRILVLLSGFTNSFLGGHHNFVARFTSEGNIDTSFGDGDGAIGSLTPQLGYPATIFADFTLDSQRKILVASLFTPFLSDAGSLGANGSVTPDFPEVVIEKFTEDGLPDDTFGLFDIPGVLPVDISYPKVVAVDSPEIIYPTGYRKLQIVADDMGGYLIAFTGSVVITYGGDPTGGTEVPFTQVLRLNADGELMSFQTDNPFELGFPPKTFIVPNFFVTDLVPDGSSGFIMSGTGVLGSNPLDSAPSDIFGLALRLTMNGELDTDFSGPPMGSASLNPLVTNFCANSALLRNNSANPSINRVLVSNYCLGELRTLKAFSPSGRFQGELSLDSTPGNSVLQTINQLKATRDGKIIVLRGARPTTGYLGFLAEFYTSPDPDSDSLDWTGATISRYNLPEFISIVEQTPVAPEIVAPTPVPFLKTVTAPKLNLTDGKLVCTAGTYQSGYTLNGSAQGGSSALFTPPAYIFNLLINGAVQTALTKTSISNTASWDLALAPKDSMVTCSTSVTVNALTNTDSSSGNTAGLSQAQSAQTQSIAAANADYQSQQIKNAAAYAKALVDNRALWRTQIDEIRTTYLLEKTRISALASTKETRALASAARKAMTAAQKKAAADYKDSKPAALAALDAANKAALDAKEEAMAKANASYATVIQSSGYGVLVSGDRKS